MSVVIQNVADNKFLAYFDVEAYGGRGYAEWTRHRWEAIQFPHVAAAHDCWSAVPTSMPLRSDGEPNRPLSAFTVIFEILE